MSKTKILTKKNKFILYLQGWETSGGKNEKSLH